MDYDKSISTSDTIELLGISYQHFRIVLKEFNLKSLSKNGNTKYYCIDEINEIKKKQECLFKTGILASEVNDTYSLNFSDEYDINHCFPAPVSYPLPHFARIKDNNEYYLKKDIENALNSNILYIDNQPSKYISKRDAMLFLEVIDVTFYKILKIFKIRGIGERNYRLFLKKDLQKIKFMQEQFIKDKYNFYEVIDLVGENRVNKLIGYDLPIYIVGYGKFYKMKKYYLKYEADELNNKINIIEHDIVGKTILDTIIKRLNLFNTEIFKNSPYTRDKWFNHITYKLNHSTSKEKEINAKINAYVKTTVQINQFLIDNNYKEIYMASSSELNFLIQQLSKRGGSEFYLFLKTVYEDILYDKSQITTKGFLMSKIKNPRLNELRKRKTVEEEDDDKFDDMYTFKEFVTICEYLKNSEYHIAKVLSLKTIIEQMRYLSVWLFEVLQLTNAWRTSDLVEFPKINIESILIELKINDLNWFLTNELPTCKVEEIIVITKRNYFNIHKTQRENNFFTSKSTKGVFAIIMIMLTILHTKRKFIISDNSYINHIMSFNTSDNEPDILHIHNFFKDGGITISNRKINKRMTKTISSFTNLIHTHKERIFIPKHLRGHDSLNSTRHYVYSTQKELDYISENLFERGEFGYLYDALLNIVYNKETQYKLIKERTNLISVIKNTYGDEIKLSASLKLVNYYNQIEIVDYLFCHGLDNCRVLLNNVNFDALPSKENYIQCLCSEQGCKCSERGEYPSKDGCLGCKYSIPNIYILSTIGERLQNDFDSYSKSTKKIEQRKLSMRIYTYLGIIKDAITQFGKDIVYSQIGIGITRDDFFQNIKNIKKSSEIFKDMYEI